MSLLQLLTAGPGPRADIAYTSERGGALWRSGWCPTAQEQVPATDETSQIAGEVLSSVGDVLKRPQAHVIRGTCRYGWHTAAITMCLLVETGLPLAGGIIGAGGEISWPKRPD